MNKFLNFKINSCGDISREFLKLDISTFQEACRFIARLPYGRNANKDNLKSIFVDNCGTCSTKHAILKILAQENDFHEVKLMLGIFKMNAQNTPAVSKTLDKYNLEFIPEAHNYLKFDNEIMDFTKHESYSINFVDSLLFEVEIQPWQISNYKVNFHKKYLENWLLERPDVQFDLEGIWSIREECIRDLSS